MRVALTIVARAFGSTRLKRLTLLGGTTSNANLHSGSAHKTTRQEGAICLRATNITVTTINANAADCQVARQSNSRAN